MSKHHHISKVFSSKKRILCGIIAVIVLIGLVAGAILVLDKCEHTGPFTPPVPNSVKNTIEYNGKTFEKKNNVETLLVMGLDKFEGEIENNSYNNDQQADFLMLFVIDNENSTYNAIHINRDTMTNIDVLGLAGETVGTVYEQVALAHTYGKGGSVSCYNTASAVSGILDDTKIDHYVSVTMDAVPEINDLVGGVEVEVLDDFSGIDDTLVKGEKVLLEGKHALTYVRTRYGLEDSTNTTRMIRQRQYINALIEKTRYCVENDDDFLLSAIDVAAEYMVSDCSVTRLNSLLEKLSIYEFEGIYEIEGESKLGEVYMEFTPDEKSVKELLIKLLYKPV